MSKELRSFQYVFLVDSLLKGGDSMNSLFVGIDVSTQNNQVCAINFDQHVFFNLSFPNTPDGCDNLITAVKAFVAKENFDAITIVTESTSVYDFHICAYLSSQLSLVNTSVVIYSVNAKSIAKYKESYIEMEKTDPGDAFLCADFARIGRCKKLRPFRSAQHIALKRLTRERYHLAEQLTREKNYVLNNIYLKISGFITLPNKDLPFYDNFSASNRKFLTDYVSPFDLADRPFSEIIDYFKSTSKNRCDDYHKIASLFDKAIRSSYRLDQTAYEPITISITASINLIQCMESQIKMVDKAIEKEMKGLYPNQYLSLMSITGIGPVFAAGILSEIGDISYFNNHASLAKYAGFHWKKHDSGKFTADKKHSANACNKYLKYYITQATQMSVMYHFDYTCDFYYKKYNEATTHKHRRALVLTSRKLVRLIYVLLRDNKLYVSVSHDTASE